MAGFSLMELMIVVVVLGLLIAVGVPSMSRFMRSTRVTGAANTLVADIHYARSLATAERRTYQIAFAANGYSIEQANPLDVVRTRELPRGVTCTASDTLTMFAWGLTTPAAITIAGENSSTTLQLAANGSVSHD